MKILILKPSSLGDVVHALPVLRFLKRSLPDAEVHWWIDAGLSGLLREDPDIARLHLFYRRRWGSPRRWPELAASIRTLRAERFDLALDLQGLARSGAVAWLSNPGWLVGVEDRREMAYGFYDLAVPRPGSDTHAVDWYLEVLRRIGFSVSGTFTWIPQRPRVAESIRALYQPPPGFWIALQPGARWETKRWPLAHFQELVLRLASEHAHVRFLILGGADDQPIGQALHQILPERCLNLAGRTTLAEMVEWIRFCDGMITNDTGPMHIAAALRKPMVALFGPTDPRRTGPYGQLDSVLQAGLDCAPCFQERCRRPVKIECLWQISPRQVCDAARGWIQAGSVPAPRPLTTPALR